MPKEVRKDHPEPRNRWREALSAIGPGLITGASDDDPSGIGAYIQVGAKAGYTLLWPMLFVLPMFAGIQHICARIGRVTGQGLAASIRAYYPRWLLWTTVGLLLLANIASLAADLGAMGACFKEFVGGPALAWMAGLTLFSVLMELYVPYAAYVKYLKWICASILAYIAAAFFARADWAAALKGTFIPRIRLEKDFVMALMAVIGATFDPYPLFWQASEEAEEQRTDPEDQPLLTRPQQAPRQLRQVAVDTWTGIPVSAAVGWFILLTAAATLHAKGHSDVQTAAQAASALQPIAGRFAAYLFAAGIVGTGLLALPVLTGSGAYAIGEALGWSVGLEKHPARAKRFYAALAALFLAGLGLNGFGFNPMKALLWASVLNGLIAAPLMLLVMHMATRQRVMKRFPLPRGLKILGWLATAVVWASALATLASLATGR